MRKIPLLGLMALMLVSCSPKEESSCGLYIPDPEAMTAYHIGACHGYGHKTNTPEMLECVQKEILDIRKKQDDFLKDLFNLPSSVPAPSRSVDEPSN